MPIKLTQEQAKAKDKPGKPILVGQYRGSRTKTEFQCPYCHTFFLAEPLHIWQNNVIHIQEQKTFLEIILID